MFALVAHLYICAKEWMNNLPKTSMLTVAGRLLGMEIVQYRQCQYIVVLQLWKRPRMIHGFWWRTCRNKEPTWVNCPSHVHIWPVTPLIFSEEHRRSGVLWHGWRTWMKRFGILVAADVPVGTGVEKAWTTRSGRPTSEQMIGTPLVTQLSESTTCHCWLRIARIVFLCGNSKREISVGPLAYLKLPNKQWDWHWAAKGLVAWKRAPSVLLPAAISKAHLWHLLKTQRQHHRWFQNHLWYLWIIMRMIYDDNYYINTDFPSALNPCPYVTELIDRILHWEIYLCTWWQSSGLSTLEAF